MPTLENIDVILHIGLHKTASTYVQNVLSMLRMELVHEGILYPRAGEPRFRGVRSRDGAQSGQAEFTRPVDTDPLNALRNLFSECSDDTRSIIISSENFTLWKRDLRAADFVARFRAFRSVKVVLVLRRQDQWLESYYKQIVDGFADRETRSFSEFVRDVGPDLVDFYERFLPWREAVGAENFHVLSYDDLKSADDITEQLLHLADASEQLIARSKGLSVPRYESVRGFDTLALRILNAANLQDRDQRVELAREFFDSAPHVPVKLLSDELAETIIQHCMPINQRCASEWFTEPVPGLCFQRPIAKKKSDDKSTANAAEVFEYLSYVVARCTSISGQVSGNTHTAIANEKPAVALAKKSSGIAGQLAGDTPAPPSGSPPKLLLRHKLIPHSVRRPFVKVKQFVSRLR